MDYVGTWTCEGLDVFGRIFITFTSNSGRFWTGLGHPRGRLTTGELKKGATEVTESRNEIYPNPDLHPLFRHFDPNQEFSLNRDNQSALSGGSGYSHTDLSCNVNLLWPLK